MCLHGRTVEVQCAALLFFSRQGSADRRLLRPVWLSAGHGLIKVGGAIVPFSNELPKNTELYRLMSTKPGED